MKNYLLAALCAACGLATACGDARQLPQLDVEFQSAYALTDGSELLVGTGEVERKWKLTDEGLSTLYVKNLLSGKEWNANQNDCDWEVAGLTTDADDAQIIALTALKANDDGFTSEYLDVVAEVLYPSTNTTVKYHIWAYPDAPGLRTQLYVKGDATLAKGAERTAEGVSFKTIKGKNKENYAASGVAKKHYASTIEGKEVEVQILGIDLDKSYKVGVSLWNYENNDAVQNLVITSVDGESKKVIAENIEVPNYKKDKAAPKEMVFDLPTDILLDGSCRLIVSCGDGNATISEIYLYENSDAEYSINGKVERVDELKSGAESGYVLAGYFDCGEKNGGVQLPYNGYVDRLSVDARDLNRSYVGYFNDTQHRNTAETPLIKESESCAAVESENINWANLVAVDDAEGDGVVMLKESHKCVNQYGVDTGDFEVSESGVYNSGLGLSVADVALDEYKWCWASWSVVYTGGEAERQLAVKRFDRARYPIDPERDIYIQANTWGSDRSREASREENILVELDVQKELGIDIQQIDDGWQNNNKDWELRSDWYPEGWSRVRAKAAENGVKLGLWGAAMPIGLDDLKRSYDEGGFVSYKLDFASFNNHKDMDDLMSKVRSFIEYTNHSVRVNWDLTENNPRYGYYWAKEYGCVYLENRKVKVPANVIYVPYLVLRDCWHLNKYTNINKFQTSIQNAAMIDRDRSDAWKHSQAYATAIGLSGVPLLFMETHFLDTEDRGVMKEIFARYKECREDMFGSYCFSVGETPDNKSWSGFQYVDGDKGHLLLFRELNNGEVSKRIRLEFVRNRTLEMTDVMSGERVSVAVDGDGYAEFEIAKSGDFRLYKF